MHAPKNLLEEPGELAWTMSEMLPQYCFVPVFAVSPRETRMRNSFATERRNTAAVAVLASKPAVATAVDSAVSSSLAHCT